MSETPRRTPERLAQILSYSKRETTGVEQELIAEIRALQEREKELIAGYGLWQMATEQEIATAKARIAELEQQLAETRRLGDKLVERNSELHKQVAAKQEIIRPVNDDRFRDAESAIAKWMTLPSDQIIPFFHSVFGDAHQLGQEAMRERAATRMCTYGSAAMAAIRAMSIEKP